MATGAPWLTTSNLDAMQRSLAEATDETGAAAVYIGARAEQVPDIRAKSTLAIFSAALEVDGGTRWQLAAVTGSAPFRLYHARASAHFQLDAHVHRVPVHPTRA